MRQRERRYGRKLWGRWGLWGKGGSPTDAGGAAGSGGKPPSDAAIQSGGTGGNDATACKSGAECATGFCVDGVCCENACDGQCQSCKAAGSVGKCTAIKGSPVGSRPACSGAGVCQGQCEGTNGKTCVFPDSATICTGASCAAGKVTTASVCNSIGACSTPTTSACPNSECATDGSAKCATSCTATSCGTGAYCDTTGACLASLSAGASCSSGNQCTSGYCVDGVCCDGKCDGQCESCKETASVGKCTAIKGAPLATRTACGGTGTCKGQCDGSNGKACTFPDSAVVCTAGTCTGGKATTASVCNGSGACTTSTTSPCDSNVCATDGSGKCSGSCTAASCSAGTYCDSTGTCTKTLDNGASCSTGTQCTSGNCVDGVCCDGACTGQCQSCKETGSVGKCKSIKGDPVSPRAACGGTGKCKAQCDGTNATACAYPNNATVCTAATCTAGKVSTASVCNGSGSCTDSTTNACDSNLCASDGVSCAGSCTATSCAVGSYCGSGGACTPTLADGKVCSGDNQCAHGNCVAGICCGTACGTCHSCATGVCNLLSIASACTVGTTAGVCDNTGTCNACAAGSSCTDGVNAECQTGAIDCSTGRAVCKATNKSNTTNCGAGPSCSGGYATPQATCLNGSCGTATAVRCDSGTCSGTTCLSCSTTPGASSPPTGISVMGTLPACSGTSIKLTRTGGSLGAGASWVWSTDSSFIGGRQTGDSITVTPSASTTYYVRAEGTCGNTTSKSQVVSIYPAPQFATNPQSYSAECHSTSWVVFSATPVTGSGIAPVSSIQWYCGFAPNPPPSSCDNRYHQDATTWNLQVAPQSSDEVYCTFTDTCGRTATSAHATLTVPDPTCS